MKNSNKMYHIVYYVSKSSTYKESSFDTEDFLITFINKLLNENNLNRILSAYHGTKIEFKVKKEVSIEKPVITNDLAIVSKKPSSLNESQNNPQIEIEEVQDLTHLGEDPNSIPLVQTTNTIKIKKAKIKRKLTP